MVFDTETTGLPADYSAPVSDSAKWPYIIQLGFMVFDTTTKEILEYTDIIIRLDKKIEITPESIAIHQITPMRCQMDGIPIKDALTHFADSMKEVDIVVGHNIQFDKRMLMAEFHRNRVANCFYREGRMIPDFCTMKRGIDLCRIPAINKTTGETYNKWPTLTELHVCLFGEKPKGTHNAIADVMICLRCYIKMTRNNDIVNDLEVKLVFRSLFKTYCMM